MEKLFNSFVQRVEKESLAIEGIAINCEGKLIFEHRWAPDKARNIYSHTKSFTATAVGIAISEGKINLSDSLASCFPKAIPKNASPLLYKINLQHLLTMSSGFNKLLLMNQDRRDGRGMPDYLKYMMNQEVLCEPGSRFKYSTSDTILLGRMVEAKVGMLLSQYLYEKLFRHMDVENPIWEHCPMGHPVGGAGMFLHLKDMMKLGQLYLDKGRFNGVQIFDSSWTSEATFKQIETTKNEKDIWRCGYGYQFWLSPYPHSYRADGLYGQITTVLPMAGVVVGIQCPEEGDFEKVKEALHEELLSRI